MELLLKKYFGYDEFRPMQKDIIMTVLNKKDSVVLMPTGGGKSLCFQIPAIQLEGLTIVISPLISLMKDQVDNLKLNGINAEYINSSISFSEIENIKKRIQDKEVSLLYIAPERLAQEEFKVFLLMLKISLIAIDEAHCISAWGHDFRPDYRSLKFLKELFPHTPIMALTATATTKVRKDIVNQLSLVNPEIFVSSFDRENLNLIVMDKKKNVFSQILSLIRRHRNESIIIYCFSRKDTETIAEQLNENGFKALPYHAGLSNEIRKQTQDSFINDEVNIIAATIAFGMGIDKPDIRLVIHHTFSRSIESYYQEIGRAGRDGHSSNCVLFYSKKDKRKHNYFIDLISDENVKQSSLDKLDKMMIYCESLSCRRSNVLAYFGESYEKNNCNGCDVCTNIPEAAIDESSNFEEIRNIEDFDNVLYKKLITIRKEIAYDRSTPPTIIFSDDTLKEMCTYFPKDREEFLRIKGVGEKKSNDFADSFLEIINDHLRKRLDNPDKNIWKIHRNRTRHLSKNYQKTKGMISKKYSIKQIAELQGLKERRIVYHIEKLIEGGEVIDIEYLMPPIERFQTIQLAFEKLGLSRLAPIYKFLNEKYSYDEIRLVKISLTCKNNIVETRIKTPYHKKLEQIKETHPNAYEKWTTKADEQIKELYQEGKSVSELCDFFQRQPGGIRSRLKKLGLTE